MKKLKSYILGFALVVSCVFPSIANATTVQEKVAGLYIAFFNRAADKNGLEFWQNQAATLGEDKAVKILASGFAKHPKFVDLYKDMSDKEFVEAIYKNSLGQAGDNEGIKYWVKLLADGMSRSDMVANFVSAALDFDRTSPVFAHLEGTTSPYYKELSVLDIAQQRQDLLANKVALSLKFIELLGNETNIDPSTDVYDPKALDLDKAYKASVNLLHGVTYDNATKDKVLNLLNLISSTPSLSIDIINRLKEQYGSVLQDDQTIKLIQSLLENLKQYNANFGTIISPVTGKVWMDRNLGASEVCTSSDDKKCYGDYYQWGRYPDGHEKADSATTLKTASSFVAESGKFVISSYDWTKSDVSGAKRSENYNICPVGFRLPSIDELQEEQISNSDEAYSSLKLPTAGERTRQGRFKDKGSKGYLLSTSSVYANNYKLLNYNSGYASYALSSRTAGVPARCIKIIEPARWVVSDWGSCQAACGIKNGQQSRLVACEDANGDTLADSYCSAQKPINSQACINENVVECTSEIGTCPNTSYEIDTGASLSLGQSNTSRNIVVNQDGVIFVVYNNNGVKVSRSTDSGATFSAPVQVSTDIANAEIAVSSNNTVYVAWVSGGNAKISKSVDNAVTFSASAIVGIASGGQSPASIHLATQEANVYIIDSAGTHIYYSYDNGENFALKSLASGEAYSNVSVDPFTGEVFVQTDDPSILLYNSLDYALNFSLTDLFSAAIFYSTSATSYTDSGRYMFVSGSGTAAYRISLDAPIATTPLVFGLNTTSQGRSLAANNDGVVVDGYQDGTSVSFAVSDNLGTSFYAPIIVDTQSSNLSVAIDEVCKQVAVVYEKDNSSIIVKTINVSGLSADTTPPTFTSSDTASVNENQLDAITLVAVDASRVTYSISGGDAASFDLNDTTGVVTFKVAPDFETKSSYTFTATATDSFSNSATQEVTITILDIFEQLSTLKKTGQTKSYDTNGNEVTDGSLKDDGFYQKGVTPSYTRDDANDIVTDNLTGLMWQDDDTLVTKQWLTTTNYNTCEYDTSSPECYDTSGDTAASYCSNLTLGGYTDWRLPTSKELEGIVDYGKSYPAIDTTKFQSFSSSHYWSSTTYEGGKNKGVRHSFETFIN